MPLYVSLCVSLTEYPCQFASIDPRPTAVTEGDAIEQLNSVSQPDSRAASDFGLTSTRRSSSRVNGKAQHSVRDGRRLRNSGRADGHKSCASLILAASRLGSARPRPANVCRSHLVRHNSTEVKDSQRAAARSLCRLLYRLCLLVVA